MKGNKIDVIIFGIGEVAKKFLPYLEEQYNIRAVIDNNKNLWGTKIGSYIIESPSKILNMECDIVITSTKYAIEITEQLINMGVVGDRIYKCYAKRTKDGVKYGICPILEEKIVSTDIPLIQYDLLHAEEHENNKKKILVFCTFYSVYTKQLIENMSKRYDDIELSLLTNAYESKDFIHADNLKHIYCYETREDLKTILEEIPVYDVMQLLWIENEWVYFKDLIRRKTKRLNLNVGGSDFYRATVKDKEFKRKLIDCADLITAETECTINDFCSYYKDSVKDKIGLLPFGIEVLDFIEMKQDIDKRNIRNIFNITSDKLIVTCGHNTKKEHQHLKIVEALSMLSNTIKKQIVCVFPMTYGGRDEKYENEIIEKMNNAGIETVILKEFMDFEKMAEYALISDIMIHVQTTDQLSSTMLEEMYAGSIVIAGKWLPYKNLHEKSIYFIDVDEISDVTAVMEDVVTYMDEYKCKCKVNKELVWEHSSWDKVSERWHNIWI